MSFSQHDGSRVFAFEASAINRPSKAYTVSANLSLARKYGIPIQELPLLCRGLLEHIVESAQSSTLVITEDYMRGYANERKIAQDLLKQKRKSPWKPA
jgi:hypothetical protein